MEDSGNGNEKKNHHKRCDFHVNRSHIPLKLIYLFFMAGESCVLLYRSIYMKHLGMSTKQTGIIWTLERIFSILLPPLIGAITDITRRPKLILIILLLGGGGTLCSMYFVPQEDMVSSGWNVSLSHGEVYTGNISFCWTIHCEQKYSPNQDFCVLGNPKANWIHCQEDPIAIGSLSCTSKMSPELILMYRSPGKTKTVIDITPYVINDTITSTKSNVVDNITLIEDYFSVSSTMLKANSSIKSICKIHSNNHNFTTLTLLLTSQQVDKLYDGLLGQAIVYSIVNPRLLCIDYDVTYNDNGQQQSCDEFVHNEIDTYGVTFWVFITLIFISSFASIGSYPVIEASVLGVLGPEKRHRFGHQRLWASVGWGSAALLIGYLKDRDLDLYGGKGNPNRPFLSMFVGILICWICAAMVAAKLPIKAASNTSKVRFKDIKEVLKRGKAIAFLVLVLFYGANIAVKEIYLFWLAEVKLNAPSSMLGISTFISTLLDIPFCLAAGSLIKRFGHTPIICFGMLIYSLQVILCGVITEPWHLILEEAPRGISWGLTWVVMCSYTAKISPLGLEASTMGITQATLWGIGYGVGALLGGIFFQTFGGDKMFLLFGAMSLCVSVLFGIFSFCTRNKDDSDVTDKEDGSLDEEKETLKNNEEDVEEKTHV
uniref:uncharacterized protein LOC120341273 n=1 Tax=Styela clava TaxID=7725 RepID=UPI00193AB17C|nr:uncharacterized protein LOC120341273 [Styela clava]